ncbi:S1 RNA-binding domain-containing protein [Ruthenibacterium lactatiformans]|uniref:S1 RNA-binding domain-containing protein n=1 Tax=Ruthenibacterium lactatiformans TaxID=1550024 RepID=UPI0035220347
MDIGVHQDGLVHISQDLQQTALSSTPRRWLSVGDVVTVWVLEVDEKKKRISLTMKAPQ